MTVEELAELTNDAIRRTYDKVRAGLFPSIRLGPQGRYAVLTEPALAILRGQRPPGGQLPDRPDSAVKKRRHTAKRSAAKKKKRAKSKPVAKKSEAVPAAPVP
jgi:hypothetical protein